MRDIRLTDCVFCPGDVSRSVEEIIAEEISRDAKGGRWDVTYDHATRRTFDPADYLRKGYTTVATAGNATPTDLAVAAIRKLLDRQGLSPSAIDGFLYYDTIPWADDRWVNIAGCVAEGVGMRSLEYRAYLTQMNCTSSLSALETAYQMMQSRTTMRWFLIAGGDCVATARGEPRLLHQNVFGDAGSAALLGPCGAVIRYLRCQPFPFGWRRHAESLEAFRHLQVNYAWWSRREIARAMTATGLTRADVGPILTNQELLVDNDPTFRFFHRHRRQYGMTHTHMVMEQIEQVLHEEEATPTLVHTTGLGSAMATMVFTPYA